MKLGSATEKIRSPLCGFANNGLAMAVAAECFVSAAEIVLIFLSFQIHILFVLVADLLLLSPLKIGRALLYDTIVSDPSSVSLGLLFRYYRSRYFKTVLWRISLWKRVSLTALLISLPSFLVLLYQRYITDTGLQNTASFLHVVLLVGGVVFLVCAILYHTPSAFLVIYTRNTRSIMYLQKKVFGNTFTLLSPSYGYLLKRLPFFLFCIPYGLAKLRIQQAFLIREKIEGFLTKEMSPNLERFENI